MISINFSYLPSEYRIKFVVVVVELLLSQVKKPIFFCFSGGFIFFNFSIFCSIGIGEAYINKHKFSII